MKQDKLKDFHLTLAQISTFFDSHSMSEFDPLSFTEFQRFKMSIIKFLVQGECRHKVNGSISRGDHPSDNPLPALISHSRFFSPWKYLWVSVEERDFDLHVYFFCRPGWEYSTWYRKALHHFYSMFISKSVLKENLSGITMLQIFNSN